MATTTTFNKYGAPISLIVKKGISSKWKKKPGLSYPLAYDTNRSPIEGGYIRKSNQPSYFNKADGLYLIKNNLRQLLMTEKGERVMLPDFGLSLKKYLFEPLDEVTFNLVRNEVANNIRKYFKIVRIISLKVFSTTFENHDLRINLTLQLLDGSLDIFDVETKIG